MTGRGRIPYADPATVTSETLTVRVTPGERGALERLVHKRQADLEGSGARLNLAGVVRALVQKALKDAGLDATTAPTPTRNLSLFADDGAAPKKPSPPTSASTRPTGKRAHASTPAKASTPTKAAKAAKPAPTRPTIPKPSPPKPKASSKPAHPTADALEPLRVRAVALLKAGTAQSEIWRATGVSQAVFSKWIGGKGGLGADKIAKVEARVAERELARERTD